MTRRFVVAAVLLAVALNVAAALLGRGSFAHLILVMVASIYVAPPLFAAGIGLWVMRRRFPTARPFAIVAWTLAAIALSSAVSLVAGSRLSSRDIAEAKVYCEELAARLDEHKRAVGTFPADLSRFRHDADGPRLIRHSLSYWSDGAQFQLTFANPRGLLNGLSYRSSDRRWVEWD